ncbi:MAG: hypothetical protein ACYS0E_06795 [Planctomycetota bacterium]|jgi:hypothetical protein
MHTLPDTITLAPTEEAKHLWLNAVNAFERGGEGVGPLTEALEFGIRAVHILAVEKLQPIADRFPATIETQLERPDPEVVPYRDAAKEMHALQFIEVIDLLSEDGAECVSPHMHRGWEDRRASCHRSRQLGREACGVVLTPESRDKLVLLEAYRNRIFRVPPPVKIVPNEIRTAFPELETLYEKLAHG